MSTAVNKTGQMNVEAACIFLQKAVMLVDSKFDVIIQFFEKGNNFINSTTSKWVSTSSIKHSNNFTM